MFARRILGLDVGSKVSTQIVESIAWDVAPDIVERILREELKRNR